MKKRLAITGSGVTVIVALILIILAAVGTFSASGSNSSLVWLPLGCASGCDSITYGCEMLLLTAAAHCCPLLLPTVAICSCHTLLLLLPAVHCCSLPCSVASAAVSC